MRRKPNHALAAERKKPRPLKSGYMHNEENKMEHSHGKIIIAGIAGGFAMNLAMLMTFRLIGFGWNGGGILLESSSQSQKLISVWTEIEPIPLVVNSPASIITGILLFGVVHAYLFRWLSSAWTGGIIKQGLQFAGLIFVMTFLFWEFFTPFNLFGEPVHLIALELVFWACIALADGLVISAIIGKRASNKANSADAKSRAAD